MGAILVRGRSGGRRGFEHDVEVARTGRADDQEIVSRRQRPQEKIGVRPHTAGQLARRCARSFEERENGGAVGVLRRREDVHIPGFREIERVRQIADTPLAVADDVDLRAGEVHVDVRPVRERRRGAARLVRRRGFRRDVVHCERDRRARIGEDIDRVSAARECAETNARDAARARRARVAGVDTRRIAAFRRAREAHVAARRGHHVDVGRRPGGNVDRDDQVDPSRAGLHAARGIVELRRHRGQRELAGSRHVERIDARVVLRAHARRFVDLAVAVVVDRVSANLRVQARNVRVLVVAVVSARTIAVRVAVSVGVPRSVRARVRRLVTGVDRARRSVRTRHRFTGAAPEPRDALLDAIAIHAVVTRRIVRREAAAKRVGVALVDRARDVVVTIAIDETRRTEHERPRVDRGVAERRWWVRGPIASSRRRVGARIVRIDERARGRPVPAGRERERQERR